MRTPPTFWLILFNIMSAHALADNLSERLESTLPKPIRALKIHSTTLNEAKVILGKPALVEGEHYYWAYQGMKYSLALTFSQKTLSLIQYHLVDAKPEIEFFKPFIQASDLKSIPQPGNSSETGALRYSKNGMSFEFSPVTKKLEFVEIRSP